MSDLPHTAAAHGANIAPSGPPRGPQPGPLPGPLSGLLGKLASRAYAWAVARRNRAWDAGKGVVELDRPVISVGNLSVGGTGKTPIVQLLAQWLLQASQSPCIAMRGYRAGPAGSDEAMEYEHALPGVPVVAGADRVAGLIELFASERGESVDCILLDDGFQHRRIARQLDIVLIDATRATLDDALLPAGWLREPVSNLARAHVAVVTHAEGVPAQEVQRVCDVAQTLLGPGGMVCASRHVWRGVRIAADGQTGGLKAGSPDKVLHVRELRGLRMIACCAIGNPHAFLAQARTAVHGDAHKPLAHEVVLRDHDPYEPSTIRALLDAATNHHAEAILVTRKDWVKLTRVKPGAWPCPVLVPELGVELASGEQAMRERVLQVCSQELGSTGA